MPPGRTRGVAPRSRFARIGAARRVDRAGVEHCCFEARGGASGRATGATASDEEQASAGAPADRSAGARSRSRSGRCPPGAGAAAPRSRACACQAGMRPRTTAAATCAFHAGRSLRSPRSGDGRRWTPTDGGAPTPTPARRRTPGSVSPSGHREAGRYSRHAASSAKRSWKSTIVREKSRRPTRRPYAQNLTNRES